MRQRLSAPSLARMAITPPSASASRFPGISADDFADWFLKIMRRHATDSPLRNATSNLTCSSVRNSSAPTWLLSF